jgi:hypothetical protein
MTERRYDDDEIAEIFEIAAAEAGGRGGDRDPGREGLTLSELQAIGSDVGIPPDRIAQAARSLEGRASVPAPRTLLGVPRSVHRIVPLERPLDDVEWERLVTELRATFGAVGKVSVHGSLRTWRNGNLQAHVEPDGEGWRLRMQTLKGDAASRVGLGATFAAVGPLLMVLSVVGGVELGDLLIGLIFTAVGLGQIAWVRLALPGWRDERAEQMEQIERRLPVLLKP